VSQHGAHFIANGRYPAGKYTQFNRLQSYSPCIDSLLEML
jgi:hypothetical protein